MRFNKSGQVWVETVVYTLIGISLIGLVLAIITPQIKDFRDKSLIEQTIDSFNVFDSKVSEVVNAPGNRRKIEWGITRGNLFIDSPNNVLRFELDDSNVEYSESGLTLEIGRVNVTTEELGKGYKVIIEMFYSHDITFEDDNLDEKVFNPASIPYSIFIENKGFDTDGNLIIDISN